MNKDKCKFSIFDLKEIEQLEQQLSEIEYIQKNLQSIYEETEKNLNRVTISKQNDYY